MLRELILCPPALLHLPSPAGHPPLLRGGLRFPIGGVLLGIEGSYLCKESTAVGMGNRHCGELQVPPSARGRHQQSGRWDVGVPGCCKLQTPSSPYPDHRHPHRQGPGPLSEKPNRFSENQRAQGRDHPSEWVGKPALSPGMDEGRNPCRAGLVLPVSTGRAVRWKRAEKVKRGRSSNTPNHFPDLSPTSSAMSTLVSKLLPSACSPGAGAGWGITFSSP